ncbi:MAG: radical SAM protein [Candidatus Thiodiazotropha taylori]|nr:radical SAM protein [Candidatus Thiodiazotropha taylori]MCW4316700.1 radical SAM protein [Candidatus Thiodiazotropha taylori]
MDGITQGKYIRGEDALNPGKWITAPFWWYEKAHILRKGQKRFAVSFLEREMVCHWAWPKTDQDIAVELDISLETVSDTRSDLVAAGVIVPAENIVLDLPAIELEITASCNADCIMCPRNELFSHRGIAHMSDDVFDSVLRNLSGRGVPAYYLCGLGEPLLHPHWLEFAQRLRAADPDSHIICSTNGFSINSKVIGCLIDSPIDTLELSLHSLDPTVHYSIVRSFELKRALERIEALLEALASRNNPGLEVRVGQVLLARYPDPDPQLQAWARQRGLVFNAWRSWNRAGHVPDSILVSSPDEKRRFFQRNLSPGVCKDFAEILFIDHRGEVLSCCCDAANETAEFNVRQHSMEQIIKARLEKLASNGPLSPICHRCDAPATNKPFCATSFFCEALG